MPWRWIAWGTWLVLCAAACDGDPQAQARGVCTVVCRCEAPPLSAIQDECVEDCVGTISGFGLPQACTDCVFQNADRCNALEEQCEDPCDLNGTPPPDDEPPPIVDAGV